MRSYALIALALVLMAASVTRNAQWIDEGTLWEDIIKKAPRKARAYNEYGLHVLNKGDPERALRLIRRSMEIDPYQPQVYVNLGLAFERVGQAEKAIAAYNQAISVDPGNPAAYYDLGVLYYRTLKDRERALSYFLLARDLDPGEPDVHQFLANIYIDQGHADLARQEMALYDRYRH